MLYLLLFLFTYFSSAEESYKLENIFNFPNVLGSKTMDMTCFDKDNCLMISTDYNATGCMVYKTSDGGITWHTLYADSLVFRQDSIYFPKSLAQRCKYFDDGTMIIITSTGKILRSENFGKTFDVIQIPNYNYQSFEMIDKKRAATVSIKTENKGEYALLKSLDGCQTWEKFDVPDSISKIWNFVYIYLQKDNSMIISCDPHYGISYDTNYRYYFHTDFEGNFWNFITTDIKYNMKNLYYFNKNEGIATGRIDMFGSFNDSALVLKTYNGGKNWEVKLKVGNRHEYFTSLYTKYENNILVCGSGFGFFKSTDQGESWFYPNLSLDTNLIDGVYFFTLSEYMGDEFYAHTSIPSQLVKGRKINTSFELPSIKPKQIYPNPVTTNREFTFEYDILNAGSARIFISDIWGNEIKELFKGFLETGYSSNTFMLPNNISSGTYWLVNAMNGYKHIQMLNVVK
jgi:photosystem II stability/assembly factor-like uncharacterized protein